MVSQNLRDLIESGLAFPAMLPDANDYILTEAGKAKRTQISSDPEAIESFHSLPFKQKSGLVDLSSLDSLVGYTVPLIAHDYSAKTPLMWNTLYEKHGLNMRNIMLVADPNKVQEIMEALRTDPKYLGGGAGVGFKEAAMPYLDSIEPKDVKAINIIVKENGQLIGRNTDVEGLMRSLEEKLELVEKTAKGQNFIIIGAGGVAQQFARTLAERGANYIAIVNRTFSKAVALADSLNKKYKKSLAIGVGENMTRGVLLNSEHPPTAIINLSDKGSDAFPDTTMFYSAGQHNEHISREMVAQTKALRPDLIYVDIVLPKNGRSISLRVVDAAKIDPKYTLDGKPMVVYQAVPAYQMVAAAHPKHHTKLDASTILETFKKAAS